MYMHFSAFMLILHVLLIILISLGIKWLMNTSIMWFSFKGQKKVLVMEKIPLTLTKSYKKENFWSYPLGVQVWVCVCGGVESTCLLDLKDLVYWGQFPGSNTEYKWSFCLFTQKLRRVPLKAKCTNPNLIKDSYLSESTSEEN